MATYKSEKAAATVSARAGLGVVSATAKFSLSAALALNDVMEMVKVPAGATVLDVILHTDDLDTNGTPTITLDVGDGADADYFLSASQVARTGGVARADAATFKPKTYVAEGLIQVTVSAAPATGATSGDVELTVLYTMDR